MGTIKEIVNILSEAIKKVVATEEHKKTYAGYGIDPSLHGSNSICPILG